MRRILPGLLACTLLALTQLAVPTARADRQVDSVDVTAQLADDGTLALELVLTGVEGDGEISHEIPKRAPLGDLRELEYSISDVSVTSGGTDLQADVQDDSAATTITFDPAEAQDSISISYQVTGAVSTPDGQGDQRHVSWPLVQGFDATISSVTGTVHLLQSPPDFECRVGPAGATNNCALWNIDAASVQSITFQDGPLSPGDVLVASASQPASVVDDSSTVHTRWTLDRAFHLDLWSGIGSLAILLVGGLLLWVWHRRRGRDYAAVGAPTSIGEFAPVGDGVSEFRLVADVRPGQIGTVADETVDPIDVTGSIIDLAVRGYLRINQLEVPGGIDWAFERLDKPADDLHPYEASLLEAVAPLDGEQTLVSDIQQSVGPLVGQLQHELYDDVVAQGWFTKHPEAARTDSRTIGAALLVIGLVTTGLLAWLTTFGLLGVAVVTVGVASLFVAREMSRRSASGSALLAGLQNFSAILNQQRTDTMPEGRELEEISKLLPYAIVLGGKERWIQAMVNADVDDTPDPDALYWYHAPSGWHLQQLPQSLDALIASLQGHLFGR